MFYGSPFPVESENRVTISADHIYPITESEFKSFKNIFIEDWKSELLAVESYGEQLLYSILWKDIRELSERQNALRRRFL